MNARLASKVTCSPGVSQSIRIPLSHEFPLDSLEATYADSSGSLSSTIGLMSW